MCRIFGCVAAEPVSLRHELLGAPNPLIRQSEHLYSGWGIAVYERAEGEPASGLGEPHAERLLGDELSSRVRFDPLNERAELTGEERGHLAAERALRIAGAVGL